MQPDEPSARREVGHPSNPVPDLEGRRERVLLLRTLHLPNRAVEDLRRLSARKREPTPKALHLRLAGIRLPLGPTLPCNPSMLLSSVALEAQHRPLRDIPLHLPRNTKLEARSPRLEPKDQLHPIHLEARASTLAVTEVLRLHLPVKAVLLQAPADAHRAGGQRNRPCRRKRSRRKCPGCESLHTLVRSLREWFVTCSLPPAVPSTVDSFGKLLPGWSLPT